MGERKVRKWEAGLLVRVCALSMLWHELTFVACEPLGKAYKVLPFSFLFRQKARDWQRSYFKRFSIHHIRHLPKNKLKNKTKQPANYFLIFSIQKMTIYWYAHVIKEGKISPKRRKIDSCLFVSKFTIYLVNSFLFIVLSSRHPYYDFDFIYL